MPQYFVPKEKLKGRAFTFDDSESRHLTAVLRKKPGDYVQVFDGEGHIYPARITEILDGNRVRGELLAEFPAGAQVSRTLEPQGQVQVELYPAVLKGPRFEWLLEKAVELGAAGIFPVITERTLIDFDANSAARKTERWRKIILGAAKQCERAVIPEIREPVRYEEALSRAAPGDTNLILWERENANRLLRVIDGLRKENPGSRPARVRMFSGPEGGFTLGEVELARKSNVQTLLLSPTILRAETAAIAALTLLRYGTDH